MSAAKGRDMWLVTERMADAYLADKRRSWEDREDELLAFGRWLMVMTVEYAEGWQ